MKTFTIMKLDGPLKVNGYLHKSNLFGFHFIRYKTWRVTHLPTGFKMMDFRTKDVAINCMDECLKALPDIDWENKKRNFWRGSDGSVVYTFMYTYVIGRDILESPVTFSRGRREM